MAKRTKLTNLIVIDASGSMASKKDEVIGGLKQLFKTIKEDHKKSKAKIAPTNVVVDFSSHGDFNVIVNSSNLNDLTDKVAESYDTRGMTALFDAIGKGFNLIGKDQSAVFVNIITDGQENDSKEFNSSSVTALIKGAKERGWAVTFMGTTEESINQATRMGISIGNTMSFTNDKKGVTKAMMKVNSLRSYYSSKVESVGEYDTQHSTINLDNLMEDSENN